MNLGTITVVCGLFSAGAAYAQTSYSPEDFAVIAQGEQVSFDSQSVRTLGELTRFEILIRARKADDRPVGSAARRLVRYVAKCASGQLALASVTLIDDSGRVLENMLIPPGSNEFKKPTTGSQEAGWIEKACK